MRDKRLESQAKSLFRPSYGENRNYTLMYTQGTLASREQSCTSIRVLAGEQRHILAELNQLLRKVGNNAFGPYNAVIGSVLNKLRFANLAMQRFDSQNVNVSSSAIKMTGGPPDEIFTALGQGLFASGRFRALLERLHGREMHFCYTVKRIFAL